MSNRNSYDFEDTYDGLGEQLDETLDEYNDETFGASAADVRRHFLHIFLLSLLEEDFDFFGKTAKIANVIEEEQMTYARSHSTKQHPPPKATKQPGVLHQQQKQPPQHKTHAQTPVPQPPHRQPLPGHVLIPFPTC